jgi:hypothetical protein
MEFSDQVIVWILGIREAAPLERRPQLLTAR